MDQVMNSIANAIQEIWMLVSTTPSNIEAVKLRASGVSRILQTAICLLIQQLAFNIIESASIEQSCI